jgi:tryptophanyl-tRNA synthetase
MQKTHTLFHKSNLLSTTRALYARQIKKPNPDSSEPAQKDQAPVSRILTGMQPTGRFHIGNYLGTLKQWKTYQDNNPVGTCYFFLADLHALSDIFTPRPDSQIDPNIGSNTLYNFATVLACGVDPTKSNFYIQSQIPMISELFWILSSAVPLHWLNRMTQYKSKKTDGSTAALYTYPILMAADILLFKGNLVPVGDDQTQHIELAREIAERINKIASKQILPKPKPLLSTAPRVMSLHDATSKMSKSDPIEKNKIYLLDRPEVIRNKIAKAKTDSLLHITNDPQRKELANLIQIYAGFKGSSPQAVYAEFEGKKLMDLKNSLSELMIAELVPIQQRYDELVKDREYLKNAIEHGKISTLEEAYKNLKEIKEAFNLIRD